MPELLAGVRPESWNVPLFLHVLGAMILVGTVATVALAELSSGATAAPAKLRRLGFWSLLLVGVPSFVLMRVAAEWVADKAFGGADDTPAWVDLGYVTADAGGLLLLISLVLAGLALRRQSNGLAKATGVIMVVLVVAWLVSVWAMGAKPG